MNLKVIISPSISPVYYNNPGYTFFELEWQDDLNYFKIMEVSFRYFSLMQYILFRSDNWNHYDVMKEMGIDLNSADSIRDMYQRFMNNVEMYSKFESMCFGLDWWSRKFYSFVAPLYYAS